VRPQRSRGKYPRADDPWLQRRILQRQRERVQFQISQHSPDKFETKENWSQKVGGLQEGGRAPENFSEIGEEDGPVGWKRVAKIQSLPPQAGEKGYHDEVLRAYASASLSLTDVSGSVIDQALNSYVPAQTTVEAAMKSFAVQSHTAQSVRERTLNPTDEELEHILYHAEQALAPARWKLSKNWNTKAAFEEVIRHLDGTSSPGYPLLREAPTIRDWLYIKGTLSLDQSKVDRLWDLVQKVFKGEYIHYWRVFIKDEPHKRRKALEGRWRLITAGSLPVTVAWMMTFKSLNDNLSYLDEALPVQQGYVSCAGGWKRFKRRIEQEGLTYSVDKQAWDWGAPGWAFDADLELRTRLCSNPTTEWHRVATLLYADAFRDAKLLLPSGHVYQQQFHGFMKSGCYNTISTNSNCQILLHYLAEYRCAALQGIPTQHTPILACGDDTLQAYYTPLYGKLLEQAGCTVKEATNSTDFMGFNYDDQPEPMYFEKHLVNFALQKPGLRSETLESYVRMYANSKKRHFWRAVADHLEIHLMSDSYYARWANVPEP